MSLSRAEVQAMDRDELVETVVELSERVADQQTSIDVLVDRLNELEGRVDDVEDSDDEGDAIEDVEDRLHRERSKLTRRVSALEDELGIAATDALAVAEGGEDAQHLTKLARLVRHGPEAVSDQPTATMYRAKELVENWNRWGTVRNDALGKERRLASKQHHLRTRLEDARNESLAWTQVYRAMELAAEWSDGAINLQEGSDGEGKYVLVHRMEVTE